ncbi:MAG: MMPL family transporter [Polyangia bacterium]
MDIARLAAEKIARWQVAHPVICLVAAIVVTALAGWAASGLGFDSSYEALLPRNSAEVANADRVRERTGGTRQLVVALGGASPEARLEFGRKLEKSIEEIENVRCADLEFPVGFFRDRALWLMEDETLERLIPALEDAIHVAKAQASPFALHLDEEQERKDLEAAWSKVDAVLEDEGLDDLPFQSVMTSEDGRYTFLLVVPSIQFSDMEVGADLLDEIERRASRLGIESTGIEMRLAGNLAVMQEQHRTMLDDLRNASLLALLCSVLVVAGVTRRLTAPLVVGASLVAGVTWTFALARAHISDVNIITGFLVAVLFGLGIDFGIHVYMRYEQERRHSELDKPEALVAALRGTLPPALIGALTTAGTFFSFTVADFRGFSEFGLIAGIGVLCTIASSFLVLPPLLLCTDRRKSAQPAIRSSSAPARPVRPPLAAAMVAACLALAAFGAANAHRIPFRNNFKLLRGESPATEFFEYVDENLGVGFNPAVVLVGDAEAAERVERIVEESRVEEPEKGAGGAIGKVVSISDLLPDTSKERVERIEKLRVLLLDPKLDKAADEQGERAEQLREAREMVRTEPWSIDELPSPIRRRFTTLDDEQVIVYIWPAQRNDADYQAAAWEKRLGEISRKIDTAGIEHLLADETLIVAWIYRLILEDSVPLLALAVAVVVVLLILDFRSIRHAALVFFPLVVGMLIFVALLRLLDIELNMFNLVVVPSVIGIGIDNAVHIYHRYRVEGPGSLDLVVRRTGVAAFLASLTTSIGFGSSLISHHIGLQTLGLVAILGIGSTFASATIFFPCTLYLIERSRAPRRSSKT